MVGFSDPWTALFTTAIPFSLKRYEDKTTNIFVLAIIFVKDFKRLGCFLQTQIAKFMGPTCGPPGSSRPQMGPMLSPWTLLSRMMSWHGNTFHITGPLCGEPPVTGDLPTWRLLWLISPWTKWLAFWQTTMSNWFSWKKMLEFWFNFQWNWFPGIQLTITQHWFR